MDDRTVTLALIALLLVSGIGLLAALWYLLRPAKKKAPAKKQAPSAPAKPAKIVGRIALTKKERVQRSLDTLEVAARWGKTLYAPTGKPGPGSYVALFRAKGEKHRNAIIAQVKQWLAEG